MKRSLLLFALVVTAALPPCAPSIAGFAAGEVDDTVHASAYQPYNLQLGSVDLEFWLDYHEVLVHSNITVEEYAGGDIVLNGSDLLTLDAITVSYLTSTKKPGDASTTTHLTRNLIKSVCKDARSNLIIPASQIPWLAPGVRSSNGDSDLPTREFVIAVRNRFNPEENSELSGMYRSRNLLITQNEAEGFRRITFYPDRPDVLARFRTVMHADAKRFPVLLSNGNLQWSRVKYGQRTTVYYDPYVKPSYLFAIAAGPLVSIQREVVMGQSCMVALQQLVGSDGSPERHHLAKYCRMGSVKAPTQIVQDEQAAASFSFVLKRKFQSFTDYVKVLFLGGKTEPDSQSIVNGQNPRANFCPLHQQHQDWSGIVTHTDPGMTTTQAPQTQMGTGMSGVGNEDMRPAGELCPWKVLIRVWAEESTVQLSQLEWALESAEKAMLYDEVRFGRYYDLSEFSIVACRDFNAGAMENKGLNIFNEALIVADQKNITTDSQLEQIRGVIAHEYFHNWSGDRVTIRDWFQLTLKEGLTVFRDQSFTDDLSQASLVKRLRDIDLVETAQFLQDATPMAHPVRPASYKTVENFYTVTVYEKGAEIIRMYQTLLGDALFRQATDHFFQTNMDSAATCEHFLESVQTVSESAEGSVVDWQKFFAWYSTPGTPILKVTDVHWSSMTEQVRLKLQQTNSGESSLVIPVRLSLWNPVTHTAFVKDHVYVMEDHQAELLFYNITNRPILSLLRGFSAPVKLESFQSDQDLAFLAKYDDDPYIQYKALDQLISNQVRHCLVKGNSLMRQLAAHYDQVDTKTCPLRDLDCEISDTVLDVYKTLIARMIQSQNPSGLFEQLLSLPKISRLKTSGLKPFEPAKVHAVIRKLRSQVLLEVGDKLMKYYIQLEELETGHAQDDSPEAIARRAVKNRILQLLLTNPTEDVVALALKQLRKNAHANDSSAALRALASSTNDPDVQMILTDWLLANRDQPLLVDRWLSAQMSWLHADAINRFEVLLANDLYANSRTPNRLRALTRAFASNPVAFHQPRAYELVASEVLRWDAFNSKLAASLASSFNELTLLPESLQTEGLAHLERILQTPNVSKNTREIVESVRRKLVS